MFKYDQRKTMPPEMLYQQLPVRSTTKDGIVLESRSRGVEADSVPESLKNQFIVFQIAAADNAQTVLEASEVEPTLKGSEEQPDVLIDLQMQAFHLGSTEKVSPDTRATMRLVVGKDRNSRQRLYDNLFWTVSAGLQLYNEATGEKARPDELSADITGAFGNRPIEIPGGLANMTFEVIKHPEPTWYDQVFNFFQSDTGKELTALLGFPAITQNAVRALDQLFERFFDTETEVLFESQPMILALSQQAKQDYTGGNPRIRIGSLNPGFCILARGRDFTTIAEANAYFYPHYGILAPAEVNPGDVVTGNYEDPFKDCTYAVFKVGMQATNLRPNLAYGA